MSQAKEGLLNAEPNLGAKVERLLSAGLDEDERFVNNMEYIRNLNPDSFLTERKLRISLENRELEINDMYLENFNKINEQVKNFVDKIAKMNSICEDLTQRIQSNKDRTRDLLKKTAVLQNEKKVISAKQEYLESFFANYSLTDEEERALSEPKRTEGSISDGFFKALNRLTTINEKIGAHLKSSTDNLALLEISGQVQEKLDIAFQTLHHSILRECRLLNVEFLDVKIITSKSMEYLQARPDLFESALKEYAMARKSSVVRVYIDALTKGAKSGTQKPIESFSNEPLKYVDGMLSWISSCISMERELYLSLLRSCSPESVALAYSTLTNISDALCQPLKVRVEQIISKESNPIVLFKLLSIFLYYTKSLNDELGEKATLVKTLSDLHELASSMFFSVVSSSVQRILSNMAVPDYNLLPVNSIPQALLLLRDILESQNDNNFYSVVDKKEMHLKIFMHILDPLHQSIQLVCSNLHNPLDVAVYMLNCLNTIRSVVILYQHTESKLEMIKAQIDANEDVLVSEQASQILTNCDLMDVYTKSLAHRPNQGPLSKISGMESARVSKAIDAFNEFKKKPSEYQCHQTVKISSARIRESVELRTFENVLAAYAVIHAKLSDPVNDYQLSNLEPVENVKQQLLKKD